MLKRCSDNSMAKLEWSDFIHGQYTQTDISQKTESRWVYEKKKKTSNSKVQINTTASYHLVTSSIVTGRQTKDTTC